MKKVTVRLTIIRNSKPKAKLLHSKRAINLNLLEYFLKYPTIIIFKE